MLYTSWDTKNYITRFGHTLIVLLGLQPSFISVPRPRATSVVVEVPLDASTAPNTQESLWFPIRTYLSGSSLPYIVPMTL